MAKKQNHVKISIAFNPMLFRLGCDLETSGAYLILSIDAVMRGDNVFTEHRANSLLCTHTNKTRKILKTLEDRVTYIDKTRFILKPLEGIDCG